MNTTRLLAALSFFALSLGCAAPSVDLIPRYGTLDIDGNFGIKGPGNGLFATADIGQAGFSEDSGVIGLRADLNMGSPTLMLSAQSSNHDGSGTLSADLTNADGQSISAGAAIDSKLELGLYQGILTWDLVPSDLAEVGIGFGVVGLDLSSSVTDTSPGGDTLDIDEFAPVPVLALRGGAQLGDFEVSGVLDGMMASIQYDELTFIDLDVLARYRLFGGEDRMRFSVGLGYRHMALDVQTKEDNEEVALDISFSGPYVLLQFSI
jgi:hypothetical protein